MEIDLHGYDPRQIVETDTLAKIVQQAWEMGEPYLRLIHGHGRMRGISPGFVNTNTGFFGPGLSAWWNILPLFFANYALPRRDTAPVSYTHLTLPTN